MGVSIGWHPVPVNPETRWITPGARSAMHQLLLDNDLYGKLDAAALPRLTELAADNTGDVQAAFNALREAIREHGAIEVECLMGLRYPRAWDEPYTPPDSLKGSLREAIIEAHRRTLALSSEEKQAMFDAQRESFIRSMGPCEHGDYDWETCPECLNAHKTA